MYKVFFNERVITLTDKLNQKEIKKYQLIHSYQTESMLKEVKDFFENSTIENMAVLFHDVEFLKKVFFSFFETIYAAGGLVKNGEDQTLMIFRRGKWDLPKGKAEKGESIEETAVREVCEETGIVNVKLKDKLCHTYHIYKIGKNDIIKDTAWYLMKNKKGGQLTPQEKEEITEARWVDATEIDGLLKNSFGTIREVFKAN